MKTECFECVIEMNGPASTSARSRAQRASLITKTEDMARPFSSLETEEFVTICKDHRFPQACKMKLDIMGQGLA